MLVKLKIASLCTLVLVVSSFTHASAQTKVPPGLMIDPQASVGTKHPSIVAVIAADRQQKINQLAIDADGLTDAYGLDAATRQTLRENQANALVALGESATRAQPNASSFRKVPLKQPDGLDSNIDGIVMAQSDAAAVVERDGLAALRVKTKNRTIQLPGQLGEAIRSENDSDKSFIEMRSLGIGSNVNVTTTPEGFVLFEGSSAAVDTVLHTRPFGGFRALQIIKDSSATTRFSYVLNASTSSRLELSGKAVRVVDQVGRLLAIVSPAWAIDAQGQSVPAHYEINDGHLDLVVEHQNATYPVVADPDVWLPYVGNKTINNAEYEYCVTWWWNTITCGLGFLAQEEAQRITPVYWGRPDRANDRPNAFKHCYWNGRMVHSIGMWAAYDIATRHEMVPGAWGTPDSNMDLYNNSWGRTYGSWTQYYPSQGALPSLCYWAAWDGTLWVINPTP